MNYRPIAFSCLILILHFSCAAQGKFAAGAKLGLGASVIPMHARISLNGSSGNAYSGTSLTTGAVAHYMIGNRIGIETGMHCTHYSYYGAHETNLWRKRIWKGAAAMEVVNFQIPVVILFRQPMPGNPFRDITFAAGTSVDWLSSFFMIRPSRQYWLKNIHAGIRLGSERMKGRRLEYGLDFQYSLRTFAVRGVNYNQLDDIVYSRLSMLAFNVCYYFYNR